MKIIGITGKSGVGKTTTANYLKEMLKNSKTIFIDDIHINYLLTTWKDNLIELFGEDVIVDGKLNTSYFVSYPHKFKIVFEESLKYLETTILEEIDSYSKDYDWIIIDFFKLISLKNVWERCNYHILIEALDDDKRYLNITLRYKKKEKKIKRTKEEEHRLRDYNAEKYHDYKYDFIIINDYDDGLKNKVNDIVKDLM